MKTKVIYRIDKQGELIAVFPYIIHCGQLMTCFTNEGHSACDYDYILNNTRLATYNEYKYRDRLLHNFYGYNTQPIKRVNKSMFIQAVKQQYI